jgi:GTP-binding protein Era
MTHTPPAEDPMRCLVIALAGETNAGKSTLLNTLVGSKLAIVTPKVQTTRSQLKGICMEGNAQLVFIDTPGIFRPSRPMEKAMVKAAWNGLDSATTVLLVIDSKKGLTPELEDIIAGLKSRAAHVKSVAVMNKVDKVAPDRLLALARQLDDFKVFQQFFMISALTGDGVHDMKAYLAKEAPLGPWMFPADQLTDAPMRFLASEVTREKLFLNLKQELPYSLMVETEQWEERKATPKEPTGSVKVHQVIYVEKEGHKKIILGKGGSGISRIGAEARKELERMLSQRVHLFLFVKVRENWQDERQNYLSQGLDFPS